MSPGGASVRWTVALAAHAALLVAAWPAAAALPAAVGLPAAALLAAFASLQVGFLGHDVEHGHVRGGRRLRTALGWLTWNLLLGVSAAWWRDKHVHHHVDTHIAGRDPDLYALFGHDGRPQAARHAWHRPFVARQHWFFWPAVAFARLYFQGASIGFLLRRGRRGRGVELAGLLAHHVLALGAATWLLGPLPGMLFVLLVQWGTGIYMGLAFAPNHLGMPPARERGRGRLWQAAHTRNVRGNAVVDYLLGHLNLQIEHHLFPAAPRAQLRGLRPLARRRCAEAGVGYHEVGFAQALREVQAGLRAAARAAAGA